MGITYLCGVVAVGEYFDQRRSLAFGIASSGAGFGAAAMAILQQILIDEYDFVTFLKCFASSTVFFWYFRYGWRGSLIILSGLSGLHQIALSTLLRPLSSSINWVSDERRKRLKGHIGLRSSQAAKARISYKGGKNEQASDFWII